MSSPSSAELSVGSFTPLDDLDPATPGDPFTRLHYHYGQLLGAEDFNTEQRYFLLRSRLHNAVLHGFGTVWGLKVGDVCRRSHLWRCRLGGRAAVLRLPEKRAVCARVG